MSPHCMGMMGSGGINPSSSSSSTPPPDGTETAGAHDVVEMLTAGT